MIFYSAIMITSLRGLQHIPSEIFVPTDEVGRGREWSVSLRPSVRLGFPTIIWKSNHSILFKFGVGICWVSVQNWFAFEGHWPNFGHLVAKNDWKWAKMVVSDHYLEKYSHNPIQTCGVHLLGECSEMIHFWAMFVQFWASSGQKMNLKWVKMVVSNHYLKIYSHNETQTWCVHLLGECSQLICFLATLTKFRPSSGHKMTENGGFRPLSDKVFTQSNSNLLHLLGECTELICFLAMLAKFCPSSGHKITKKGGVQPLSEKVFVQSNSNLVCALIGWVFRIDSA